MIFLGLNIPKQIEEICFLKCLYSSCFLEVLPGQMGLGALRALCPSWRCTVFLSLWASLRSPGWGCSVSCTKLLLVLRNLGFVGCKQHILANRSRDGELLGIKFAEQKQALNKQAPGGREVSMAARDILLRVEVGPQRRVSWLFVEHSLAPVQP